MYTVIMPMSRFGHGLGFELFSPRPWPRDVGYTVLVRYIVCQPNLDLTRQTIDAVLTIRRESGYRDKALIHMRIRVKRVLKHFSTRIV